MPDPHKEARDAIGVALCAAVVANPRDPGLTLDELRDIARQLGAGPGALDEVLAEDWHEIRKDANNRALAHQGHWAASFGLLSAALRAAGVLGIFSRFRSTMENLDREVGKSTPKNLTQVADAMSGVTRDDLERLTAILITHERLVERRPGEFFSAGLLFIGRPENESPDIYAGAKESSARVVEIVPRLESLFAQRSGATTPATAPLDRFHVFVRKQGWTALASWWAINTSELNRVADHLHPTSVCVLCGALLEAALISIARIAQIAGQWNQKFLTQKAANRWGLNELIGQAEAAGTFSPAQTALAKVLAEHRNRIHIGQYANPNGVFAPPYSNTHEAKAARGYLDALIDAILSWPPVVPYLWLSERFHGCTAA
jgi:hypothetical protein